MFGKTLFLAFICSLPVLATRAKEEGDPFAVDAKPMSRPAGPDHLVPLDDDDSEWRRPYVAKLDAKLKSEDFAFARMICRPSFEGEPLVFIHGGEKDRELEKTGEFQVTARIAEKSIWYSLPDNNKEKQDKEVKISASTAPLEKALAVRLVKVWNQMLERTRKPDEFTDGLDGVTFEFSVPGKAGETWSPSDSVSPGLLVQLGTALREHAAAKPGEREALTKELKARVLKLEKYLAEHPPRK